MNKVYILGDIHGNWKLIRDFYTYITSASTIVLEQK